MTQSPSVTDRSAPPRELFLRLLRRELVLVRPTFLQLIGHVLRGRDPRRYGLPETPSGPRLHVGAGQTLLEGYENLDAYDNAARPDHFQTPVTRFIRAETLDRHYAPDTVAEIRCHHVFEHVSILDVDRTLRGWNTILKVGGLVWIEVPDFEGCARKILGLRDERAKEIYYRHIFGSQMGPGELHQNGFTASRLIQLLEDYGCSVRQCYVHWRKRTPHRPDLYYPAALPLPDLTAKAVKVGPPRPELETSEWTHLAYRRLYPDPLLGG